MARTQRDLNLDAIVEDIYAGTLDAEAWHRAILAITDLVGGASAVIFGVDPRTETTFRAESHNFDQQLLDEFCQTWFSREIRLAPALQVPTGEPIFDSRLMPIRAWKRSEIYNEFLYKIDKPWFLCFWLHKTTEKLSILAIHGSRSRGPLDERDGERVRPLIPHLQRALSIRDRLESSKVRIETLATAVDHLPFGVVVLDVRGKILECSSVASQLMTRTSGIRQSSDGTLMLQGEAGIELRQWLAEGAPPAHNPEGLLRTHGPDGVPLSIMITPLPIGTPSWMGNDARWMLLVFNPSGRASLRVDVIARDLGISPREAEIAALMVEGLDLREIALRLNRSLHTVRTHLKAIFAKTGHSSQGDLIQRIIRGPSAVLGRK